MPPPKPTPNQGLTVLYAGLINALNPTTVTPKEAFVFAEAFIAEAEAQYPGVIAALKEIS